MPVKPLKIFTYYDKQRFTQFGAMDCANWYLTQADSGKRKMAMYPAMGRKHLNIMGANKLQFNEQPRALFKSINYMYVVVGSVVWQVDQFFNKRRLNNTDFIQPKGDIYFAFLPAVQAVSSSALLATYCMITDGTHCYVIDEANFTMVTITDANTPKNPLYVAAFGNRFVVAGRNSTQFTLTQINCIDTTTGGFNAASLFTVPGSVGGSVVFAQESGVIQQMCVLHSQLYIFTDFITGIWSNTPTYIGVTTFPWKRNTSMEFDYGMADPLSLDVCFGRMTWLAKNRDGLVQFMTSTGQMPQSISTQAINVLLQSSATQGGLSPFVTEDAIGFLYEYEDTVFYRVSAGSALTFGQLDFEDKANCIEYNFETKTWHRCIELDGGRNRIQWHVYFANYHLVTVDGEKTVYQMAGNIYYNEVTDRNSPTGYTAYPMRYELVTPSISEENYAEFKTEYVEIDFVWGQGDFIRSRQPFENTVFLVSEGSTDSSPVYLVAEDGKTYLVAEGTNTPDINSQTYNSLFKPHIELYVSDDGGISYYSADVLEFSQLGVYQWRMRWYQLGISRNRCYKLVCVSPAPVVILGAVMNTTIISGGAN
jgi:hypothetical protein